MKKLITLFPLIFFSIANAQNFPENAVKNDSARYYSDLAQKEINPAKRIEFIDKAIKFDQTNFYLHNQKATVYYESNNYPEYERYLKKMMVQFPANGIVDSSLGFYQEGLNNKKQADAYYESSIKKIDQSIETEKNYQTLALLNFYKIVDLLFLDRKKEAQDIISNTKEKDARDFLSNYYKIMEKLSRIKLYEFIKTDLK